MWRILAVLMVAVMLVPLAQAQAGDDPYTIMRPEPGEHRQPRPEPWLQPKYKSPRGTRQPVSRPRPAPEARRPQELPPPIYVPETGRLLPNMRTMSPSGPGGVETGQDRAVRCAHQAGAYGAAAGDPNTYLGNCVNQ